MIRASCFICNPILRMLHESNGDAARNVSTRIGTRFFTPLVRSFLADISWGRFKTIVIYLSVYTIGMLVMKVLASRPAMLQSSNHGEIHCVVVCPELYLTALGNVDIKLCTSSGCPSTGYYFLTTLGVVVILMFLMSLSFTALFTGFGCTDTRKYASIVSAPDCCSREEFAIWSCLTIVSSASAVFNIRTKDAAWVT